MANKTLTTMFDSIKKILPGHRDAELHARLEQLVKKTPLPVFWLFGKTQSGKTSIVKFLTRADDAEIGRGFKPCTRFSREYRFPTDETPLLIFLDTRGLEEPGVDLAEEMAALRQPGPRHDRDRSRSRSRSGEPHRPVAGYPAASARSTHRPRAHLLA